MSFDLAIVNTFFRKREEHYITYKSGGNKAQIDFMMYRRSNLVEIKNCKVTPGDHVAPQHRLVVMDVIVRNPRGGNRNYEKIRWTGLRKSEKLQEIKTKVLNRLTTTEEGVQGWWENNARVLRNVAREVLGETSGKPRTEREEWWWKDEIQLVPKEKKELKKRWEQTDCRQIGLSTIERRRKPREQWRWQEQRLPASYTRNWRRWKKKIYRIEEDL